MNRYQIVQYSPEFKDQVLEVQKHLWGPDPVQNAEYFDWKYIRNPNQDAPLIYLALCDGKVVGMRGMIQAKWQVGCAGQTFILPVAGDLVIAPEHRNQGLFSKIMQLALKDLAEQEYPFVLNLSAGSVAKLGSLAMGWRGTPSLKMFYRPNHTRRIGRLKRKLSIFSSVRQRSPFYSFDQNGSPGRRNTGSSIVFEKEPRPKAMADLIKGNRHDGRIRQVRDEQYFAWRFTNPRSEYRFLFWEDTAVKGYLVLQFDRRRKRDRIGLVDWEAANLQVKAEMLEAAIEYGPFESIFLWSATLSQEEKEILCNARFKPVKEEKGVVKNYPSVLVFPVRNGSVEGDFMINGKNLLDLSNWDLRLIDSDGI